MNLRGLSYWLLLSLLVVPYLCGCLILPVKAKPIAEAADGTRTAPPALPIVGTTTRQEVEQRYHDFRADPGGSSLFWARLQESHGRLLFDGIPSGRTWDWINVVVAFDSNQVVQSVNAFSDDLLLDKVASMLKQGQLPPLDFSAPVKLEAYRKPPPNLALEEIPVTISLAKSGFSISMIRCKTWRCKKQVSETFVIPREQIGWLRIGNYGLDWRPPAMALDVEMFFKPKAKFGSSLYLDTSFDGALSIAYWLAQTSPTHPAETTRPSVK